VHPNPPINEIQQQTEVEVEENQNDFDVGVSPSLPFI